MTLKEMELFRSFPDSFQHLDFNAISFPQWLQLEAFYRLKKTLPKRAFSLVEFLQRSNETEAEDTELLPTLTDQIVKLTGWEGTEIDKLIAPAHFNLNQWISFRNEQSLLMLQETLKVVHRIGMDIDLLFAWGKPPKRFSKTRKIAGAIRDALRARYQQDEWEEVIRPIQDELRGNQRDALIAYLLAQPVLLDWGVRDADGLFEFFLIDVQMDACMETSRIKQAISSVQLFVQRCFLGLEKDHGVPADVLDRKRWDWMSRYRVWEANRKVFLYPENWIRGELRDDKSPFFKELESELLQNDISRDAVKNALKKYIVQVDEVANLEVVGVFVEGKIGEGASDNRIIHVIGKTRSTPPFFYYRYYDLSSHYWYPWEKVEVDIPLLDLEDKNGNLINNGTYITPVVWKDRLFIFFPQFLKKNWDSPLKKQMKVAESAQNTSMEDIESIGYWEIKLAWSEYKEGGWTPKKISKQAIYALEENVAEDEKHEFILFQEIDKFIFAPFIRSDKVVIQIYYIGISDEITELIEEVEATQYNIVSESEGISATPTTMKSFKREKHSTLGNRILQKSFRFNGDSINPDEPESNTIPQYWNSFYSFQKIFSLQMSPIQANINENDPGANLLPIFSEHQNKSIVSIYGISNFNFHHPNSNELLGDLRKDRLEIVFNDRIGLDNDNYGSIFGFEYHELRRPYAIYNWEILFHAVAMLAENLSKSQRFEESMKWWHFIFDPINVKDDIKKVWKFIPFRETDSKNTLEKIFNQLDPNSPNEKITQWREDPFMPHVIARERTAAYMQWVVMKYIDNLIAWGDALFRQDTIETINQATQLYVLAGHILGPRPEFIPKRGRIRPKSYRNLLNDWDAFSNAMVDLELIFPYSSQVPVEAISDDESHYVNVYGFATSLYFCIPHNPKLLEYWDTVADRLFKIRHCQNIEGVFRKLNLFEPPIDPALLVRAAAQGLSIGSVLSDLSTPMPNYRLNYLLARALEVTSEVKSLGNALLSALEKKDSEILSLLRAQHDTNIQTLVMDIRSKQFEEAEKTIDSLRENRKAPVHRFEYYSKLAGEDENAPEESSDFTLIVNALPEVKEKSGMKLIGEEAEEIEKAEKSRELQITVGVHEALAAVLHAIPNFGVEALPFGIGASTGFGGANLGNIIQATAKVGQVHANKISAESVAAGRKAGYLRQLHDRIFQANIAGQEIKQIDKQITTQEIRCQIAEKEIENQQAQIDQAQEVEEFLKTKFSNEHLYQWMSDQLKDLYYQTYSFAYDLAKKAEKAYRFDKGLSTSDFVKFGYWDSAKEGFLAGEQLYLALKRMENAYIETKPHDYEITKHISLRQINPLALIELKELGVCEFNLSEELFDLDYPGHYKRRIKTVAVSIPCIVGPNTSLNCTLRLNKHEFRNSKLVNNYPKKLEEADERFVTNPIPTTAIAVSQGQNDSGVFELSFQSERYLPFEGAGAISSWRLELPQNFRQFDYQTITDVVIHLRYTSCEGGEVMKTEALGHLNDYVGKAAELSKTDGLFRMFSLPHEFPNEWHHLFNTEPDSENPIFHLGNLKERFPFFAQSQQINPVNIVDIRLFAPVGGLQMSILKSDQAETLADNQIDLSEGAQTGSLHQYFVTDLSEELTGFWGIQFTTQDEPLTKNNLKDAWLVVKYKINFSTV
jgi:hypothetical protein